MKGKGLIWIGLWLLASGFSLIVGYRWPVTRSDPTLWVEFKAEDLLAPFTVMEGFPPEDPLSQLTDSSPRITVVDQVFQDINQVDTAFIRLAYRPIEGLTPEPSPLDTPFSEDLAEKRTIKVSITDTGLAGGNASGEPDPDDSRYLASCQVNIGRSVADQAYGFKAVLTHELLHCLGLYHNHADHGAIMSYNNNDHKLGVDDMMGLTHLFPLEEGFGKEAQTLGMACQRTKEQE